MSNGNGYASSSANAKGWERDPAEGRVSQFWQRWGSTISTAGSILTALFLVWHQIDLSMKLQAEQITQLKAQVQVMQIELKEQVRGVQIQFEAQTQVMQRQIDRLEARIYDQTASGSLRRP